MYLLKKLPKLYESKICGYVRYHHGDIAVIYTLAVPVTLGCTRPRLYPNAEHTDSKLMKLLIEVTNFSVHTLCTADLPTNTKLRSIKGS